MIDWLERDEHTNFSIRAVDLTKKTVPLVRPGRDQVDASLLKNNDKEKVAFIRYHVIYSCSRFYNAYGRTHSTAAFESRGP